jgi:8-oxo-dGTP pyrophosphatase MutT (NUDIX family)
MSPKGLQFLMIRRKDSFGFIDFIRGKYSTYNIDQVQNIINEMSDAEKKRLLDEPFDSLWIQMWGENPSNQYKNEELLSMKKYLSIKDGICINNVRTTLIDLIGTSTTQWKETEWEFPKGRRDFKESDLDCALREFEEETGIPKNELTLIDNVIPFEEIFIGTNHKSYKHKYFLASMEYNDNEPNLVNFQKTEVSKLEWKTLSECLESIRPYNLEKKNIIKNISKMLHEYKLCG